MRRSDRNRVLVGVSRECQMGTPISEKATDVIFPLSRSAEVSDWCCSFGGEYCLGVRKKLTGQYGTVYVEEPQPRVTQIFSKDDIKYVCADLGTTAMKMFEDYNGVQRIPCAKCLKELVRNNSIPKVGDEILSADGKYSSAVILRKLGLAGMNRDPTKDKLDGIHAYTTSSFVKLRIVRKGALLAMIPPLLNDKYRIGNNRYTWSRARGRNAPEAYRYKALNAATALEIEQSGKKDADQKEDMDVHTSTETLKEMELKVEEMECERPSSRARTEDPVNEFADVALTNMSRFASNRIDWESVFGIKITFQPQSELAVGATTAKVMLSGNSKKVWRFMAHLEYTFPNTFPKKESSEESRSPSPTLEARVRNGEMGSEFLDLVCGDRMYDIPYHREEWEMRFGVSLTIRTLYSKDAISKLLKAQLEIAGTPEQIDSFKMYLETNGWLDDVRCLTPEDQDHIDEYFSEVDKWGGNAACA